MLSFFACSVSSLCMAGIISKHLVAAYGDLIKKGVVLCFSVANWWPSDLVRGYA